MPEVCFTIFQFPYRGPTPEVIPVNVFGNVNEYYEQGGHGETKLLTNIRKPKLNKHVCL